ncbi:MAG: hypothetical protein SOZ23_01775 [Methanosphaera sp.]|nr:hypothetical protein [Methanosphaera sp.]MDD6535073.1 hypothetical protein [Methanosphaera sp.]MDY3955505.1 hypothetical protein [Methanosphaera sp.]
MNKVNELVNKIKDSELEKEKAMPKKPKESKKSLNKKFRKRFL